MSKNLEDMIRAIAEIGELTHLSLNPVAGGWHAVYSPASKWGSGYGRDADPVEAIKQAMTDKRFSGLVKKLNTTLELADPPGERELAAIKKKHAPDDSDFVR